MFPWSTEQVNWTCNGSGPWVVSACSVVFGAVSLNVLSVVKLLTGDELQRPSSSHAVVLKKYVVPLERF